MSDNNQRTARPLHNALLASILCAGTLSASFDTPAAVPATIASPTIAVAFVGWPNISGLTVLANRTLVIPANGVYTVPRNSELTVLAAGVELARIAAKPNITLFDLLPEHYCGSSDQLAKLMSLLLSLDSDQDPGNGISIPASSQRVG